MRVFEIADMRRWWSLAEESKTRGAAASMRRPRRRRRSDRRGSVVVMAAFCLAIVLACVAFGVDVGYLCLVRSQAQNSADAASMAAAWKLLDERRLSDSWAQATLASEARDAAIDYANRNRVCGGTGALLARNDGNHPKGNLVFGRLNANGTISTIGNLREHNAVYVRIGRTSDVNGSVSLLFARCIGFESADVSAEAVATFRDGIRGFCPSPKTGNTTLIPFAVNVDLWRQLIARKLGTDDWTVDAKANQVAAGGDGILELGFYPDNTGSSGNFGTLQIGDSNNGTPEIAGQIANGISEADLKFHGGEMSTGPWPGDPGISTGLQHALPQVIGRPCSIALYDTVSGSGNNAVYNVVGFAGVRVVHYSVAGGGLSIVLQPAVVVDDSAIAGTSDSYSVYQPVILAR